MYFAAGVGVHRLELLRISRQNGTRGGLSLMWLKRCGWLLLFWLAGVATLAVIAQLLRWLMMNAGLSS
jgi:hypothetical protein